MATKQNLHQVFASHVASRSDWLSSISRVPLQVNTCYKHQTLADLDDVRISHLVPFSNYSHKIFDYSALTVFDFLVVVVEVPFLKENQNDLPESPYITKYCGTSWNPAHKILRVRKSLVFEVSVSGGVNEEQA